MNITVLLVDDHAIVRDGLRMILESQDGVHVVGEAHDGLDAVDRVKELAPDLVVMDALSGTEATRRIRETCPATQVVILSMYATPEYIFQALQAGARGYVLKESAGKEVVQAVRAVHAGHRYLSEKISDVVVDAYVRQRGASPEEDPFACLSGREREVLQLVVDGRSSADIAKDMHLSPKTVDTYRSRLMHKLGIEDLPHLVKLALEHGLTFQV